jgi:threonine synthase
MFQVAYHSGDIPGVDGNFANPPVKVKENLGSVIDAIRDRFHLEV